MTTSRAASGTGLLFAFISAIVSCTAAWGVEFAGGTGEPNDPYQIATAEQLAAISSDPHLIRKHYVLTASIDLSGVTRPEPVIWLFSGTFDGNGHTIQNLRIEGQGGQALFDLISRDGEVRNLGVVNAHVTGTSRPAVLASDNMGRVVNCYSTGMVLGTSHAAGGLVGSNWGTVANSYSTATVEGLTFVGGLVGENAGTVSFCHSTGDVTGDKWVGGLVGENMGEITSSYSVATVTGTGWWIGGLVGSNDGRITASYADATVTGEYQFVGGLAGENGGMVSSCYSVGSVTGEDKVGGLVGDNAGKITTSYSVATVTGYGRNDGGLVGMNSAGAPKLNPVKDCYFLDPVDGGGADNKIGTPLLSVEMKQQASFVGWDFWGTDTDGESDVWFMPANAYPVLAWQTELTALRAIPNVLGLSLDDARAALAAAGFVAGDISYDFHQTIPSDYVIHSDPYSVAAAGARIGLVLSSGGAYDWTQNPGDGTAGNPYQVQTAGQFESLTGHPELWNECFVLSADLDLIGRVYSAALIAPDVDNGQSDFQGTPFSGTFDGQGHTIRNLTISADNRHDYVGLFGMIAQAGRIESLHLVDANVKGGSGSNSYVGVLAGYNAGTIVGCSASGVIHLGRGDGLVGFNSGSLIDCQVDIARI
jgi:hypothetical protein